MSAMRKIPVDHLKPGMRFDKPVYIDSSNILVGANISIKDDDIKKLIKWGISEIETAGEMISTENELKISRMLAAESDDAQRIIDNYNSLLKKRRFLLQVHKQAYSAVSKIHNAIKKNESFNTSELDEALRGILKLMGEDDNVFLFLYGLEEGKDYLVVHSVNVTFYALLIGINLKYTHEKLRELGMGTLLIDAGMIKMPAYIMNKKANLSDAELNLIKTHPLHGYKVLRQLGNVKESIATICLQHHEQYDGRGYPRGLKGNQIDEYARIATIADNYEALISERAHRKKMSFYHAMREMLSSGVNRFDPVIIRVFLSRMSAYPIGSLVELNDGGIGLVVGSIPKKPLRPIVKLIQTKSGERVKDTAIINLLEETSLFVVKALTEEEMGINFLEVL